jgi:hypothetical protein
LVPIGFWKENIDKYLCNWTNGRQVCSEFFDLTDTGDVCYINDLEGIETDDEICPCEGSECEDWQCMWETIGNYTASDACEKADAQMAGMHLTSMFFADGFDFVIDTSTYPVLGCTPVNAVEGCQCGEDICYYDECKDLFEEVCGDTICDVGDLWDLIVDEYQAGNCSVAQEIADCVNNYKEGCCDYSYGTDEYFRSQCEDSEPDCCPALSVCDGVYKPFSSSGCGICNQVKEPNAPNNNNPQGFNIRIELLDPLFRFFD